MTSLSVLYLHFSGLNLSSKFLSSQRSGLWTHRFQEILLSPCASCAMPDRTRGECCSLDVFGWEWILISTSENVQGIWKYFSCTFRSPMGIPASCYRTFWAQECSAGLFFTFRRHWKLFSDVSPSPIIPRLKALILVGILSSRKCLTM